MTCTNGTKVKGEWARDKMNGQGSLICPNSDSYVGEWKDNILVKGEYVSGQDSLKVIDGVVQDEDGCDTDIFIMYFERTPIKKVEPWKSSSQISTNVGNDNNTMTHSRNISFTEEVLVSQTHSHNVTNIDDHRIDHLISSHKKEVKDRRKKSHDCKDIQSTKAKIVPMPIVSQSISPIKAVEVTIYEAVNESDDDDAEDCKFGNMKDLDLPIFNEGDDTSIEENTNENLDMSDLIHQYKPDSMSECLGNNNELNNQTFNIDSEKT